MRKIVSQPYATNVKMLDGCHLNLCWLYFSGPKPPFPVVVDKFQKRTESSEFTLSDFGFQVLMVYDTTEACYGDIDRGFALCFKQQNCGL